MSEYYGFTRTNYFSVLDDTKFHEIIASCAATFDESIQIFESSMDSNKYAFGCQASLLGVLEDEDEEYYNLDAFYEQLQKVVAPDDAIIITEVGYEKLCYLVAVSTIITQNRILYVDLKDKAIETAQAILDNPNFDTELDY